MLRRAAQAGSSTSTVGIGLRPEGGASPIVRGAKKREQAEVVVTAVEGVPVISVPVRAHRGLRFFDPHGPPTEGDFASADRRTAVPPFRILVRQSHRPGLLPYRGWILSCRLLQSKLQLALVLLLS